MSYFTLAISSSNHDSSICLLEDDRIVVAFSCERINRKKHTQRIEQRQRTINGRMRSYHIADKLTLTTSWNMLPSRSYYTDPEFNATTGKSPYAGIANQEYTTDGGAGGVELLDWYENHQGPFWVYLAYDKYSNFGKDSSAYAHLPQYNQLLQMYFSDFNYSVVKRGNSNFDFWNISVTLEEV